MSASVAVIDLLEGLIFKLLDRFLFFIMCSKTADFTFCLQPHTKKKKKTFVLSTCLKGGKNKDGPQGGLNENYRG